MLNKIRCLKILGKLHKILDVLTKNCLMYKYKINELLNNMPMKDYKKAIKLIPKILGVSSNTFLNYRSIRIDEDKDIPYQKVIVLEKIFDIQTGTLINVQSNQKSIYKLIAEKEVES